MMTTTTMISATTSLSSPSQRLVVKTSSNTTTGTSTTTMTATATSTATSTTPTRTRTHTTAITVERTNSHDNNEIIKTRDDTNNVLMLSPLSVKMSTATATTTTTTYRRQTECGKEKQKSRCVSDRIQNATTNKTQDDVDDVDVDGASKEERKDLLLKLLKALQEDNDWNLVLEYLEQDPSLAKRYIPSLVCQGMNSKRALLVHLLCNSSYYQQHEQQDSTGDASAASTTIGTSSGAIINNRVAKVS